MRQCYYTRQALLCLSFNVKNISFVLINAHLPNVEIKKSNINQSKSDLKQSNAPPIYIQSSNSQFITFYKMLEFSVCLLPFSILIRGLFRQRLECAVFKEFGCTKFRYNNSKANLIVRACFSIFVVRDF